MKLCKYFLSIACVFFVTGYVYSGTLSDTWKEVIKKYPYPEPTLKERRNLASLYAPLLKRYPEELFRKKKVQLEEIERKAASYLKRIEAPPHKINLCRKRVKPYQNMIRKASIRFDVPEQIIGAVILQESSGNAQAKAKTSSAKGLMQTIDATFAFARKHLLKHEVIITDPFLPEDSMNAGAWYLSYVFELAQEDYPLYNDRSEIEKWEKALEYYYAGPVWGRDPKPIFHAYINGKNIVIKKAYYAGKVLEYAYIL